MKVTLISLLLIGATTGLFSNLKPKNDIEQFPSSDRSNYQWKADIDMGGGFVLTTFLTAEKKNDEIIITSPHNADVRVLGRAKSYLGRLFGKLPNNGALLKIQGNMKGDSIKGKAFVAIMGKMQFKGLLNHDSISGYLFKNDTVKVGEVSGTLSNETSIDYIRLYTEMTDMVKRHIYNKNILTNSKWIKFQRKFRSLCSKAQDDIELFIGFSMYSSELPFSHFHLIMNKSQESDTVSKKKSVLLEEKGRTVGYLKIDNFSTSTEELKYIMPIILKRGYENLIVDLRNNSGGGVEAAYAFAKHIVDSKTDIGYFTTNRFVFDEYDVNIFGQLPEMEPETTDGFIEYLMSANGAKMIINEHQNKVFTGHLYILTNSNTASTCESIVYVLKGRKNVTVIGETTAGAMLSANYFDLYGKYKLVLPVADFFTIDGTRLDGIGVSPDILVDPDSAMVKSLQMIQEKSKPHSY